MSKRPEISILLLANRSIVRADFAKDLSTPILKIQESVDVESSVATAIEQVVLGAPDIAQQVIVVMTDVWTQLVSLPRLSVSGIEPQELDEVLKFEAETLSGIEINDISLASSSMGTRDEFQQYWVSAIRKDDLDSIVAVLASAGCRDTTVAHPAGLSSDSDLPRERAETWEDLAFFTEGYPGKLTKVKQASGEHLGGQSNLLIGTPVADFQPNSSAELQDIADESCLDRWFAQVATNYLKNADNLAAPLIRLRKNSKSTPVRHLIAGALALAVLGFCFWHWNYLNNHNESLRAKIVEIQEPATEKKKYDSQLLSILDDRTKIEVVDAKLGNDLSRIQFFLDNQSDRFPKLLQLLVELRTPELVIQEIDGVEDGVSITGISLNGESAQALAKRLREKAVPLGWVVNAASQEGQQKLTTGGPWTFEILLTDTGPFESAARSKQKPIPNSKP